jgi:tetratricopeptide (TPR) repeat protein
MPAREKEAFKKHILSDHRAYNKIFNALAGTMIQNAKASVEEDRKNILRLVQEGCGVDKLNARVNKLLREWLNQNLVEFVHDIDSLLKVEHYGGKKPIELIVAYNHLGHVFYHNLQFELAMDCYQKQLDLSKVNFGSKDVVTSSAYNNIALVYSHWNQCDEAIELFQKNIDILLETYGNDHYNQWTASMYCNIGSAYKEKGDMDMALYYYEKCRLKSEGMYGLEHERTSSVYNEIGFVHAEKGNLDKALMYLHKSLKITEEVLGLLEHPSTAASYNNIASIYFEKGKYDDALRYFLKALHILEKVHGHHHPNTVTLYENIFLIYFEKGNIKKQAEFWEKAQLKTIIIL